MYFNMIKMVNVMSSGFWHIKKRSEKTIIILHVHIKPLRHGIPLSRVRASGPGDRQGPQSQPVIVLKSNQPVIASVWP